MTENESLEETESPAKKTRVRSTIQFPYVPLDAAIALPTAMNTEQGAASCDLDQLSSWSGHGTPDSGTFRNKVQAARYFGLITVERQRVTLTPLGRDILDPQKVRNARARAFLCVALYKKLFETYRGRALPPDIGLENEIKTLGVAEKQADKARQTFRRSAEQAGFLEQGQNRLVLPAVGDITPRPGNVDVPPEHMPPPAKDGGGLPPGFDPMIGMVLRSLPPAGQPWSAEQQEVWINVLRGVLTQVYPQPSEPETEGPT